MLTAALEAALLRELRTAYDWENDARFGKRLRAPVLALGDALGRHGAWIAGPRRLELSRALVLEASWPEVLGVLQHEMAHQYVDEVLLERGEAAHGATFQRVCEERGIDAKAAGAPVPANGIEVDRVLDRIRKLLALAGSANQHEAEVAMRRAHELMLRHNVEHAAQRTYEVRHLGDPKRRGTRVEAEVAGLLGDYFFVKVIRIPYYLPAEGRQGNVYEIAGTRANVEMAAHVWAFLLATCARLWDEHRRAHRGRDRLSYQCGVVRGFGEKLRAERVELKGTGLVWRGDAGLDRYYCGRNPRITTRSRSIRLDGAHAAGREAGRNVVLHRPVEHGGSGTVRLLSSPRGARS
jgi:hypothetical protein